MPSSDLAPLVPLGAAYCFVLGACLASFLQVVAQRAAVPGSPPFYKGRSHCDACGHALGAAELVPLFSWLLLRGRCRHCGARVPASYPLAELCGGLGVALCFAAFPFQWGRLAVALPAFFVLFLIALQDAYTMEIPDLYSLLLCLPALPPSGPSPKQALPRGSSARSASVCRCCSSPLRCRGPSAGAISSSWPCAAFCWAGSSAWPVFSWRCSSPGRRRSFCWPPAAQKPARARTCPSAPRCARAAFYPCCGAGRWSPGTWGSSSFE